MSEDIVLIYNSAVQEHKAFDCMLKMCQSHTFECTGKAIAIVQTKVGPAFPIS